MARMSGHQHSLKYPEDRHKLIPISRLKHNNSRQLRGHDMTLSRRLAGLIAISAIMAGCTTTYHNGEPRDGVVTRLKGGLSKITSATGLGAGNGSADAGQIALASGEVAQDEGSQIIADLQARPSTIESGTPFATVALSVIASDARVAEAELQVARLRQSASQYNWLPTIGPDISLNSLGEWVTSLVVDQVLFDNGRKKAERDLAKHNVELAAVNLVDHGNSRVYDALSIYLNGAEGRERQGHYNTALKDMTQFEWVLEQRVAGGVSDMSDLNVVRQKLATIRSQIDQAHEMEYTAFAELNAMAELDLSGLSGLGGLRDLDAGKPLGVIRAEAQRDVDIAQARIDRASHLPGLGLSGSVDKTGEATGVLGVTTDKLFGLGTGSELKALEIIRENAGRQVLDAQQQANRDIAAQSLRLEAYRRQADEAAKLTRDAKHNLDLFQQQFENGQRQVMAVVGVYETYADALEKELDLKYKAQRTALELARLRGALAEGAQI